MPTPISGQISISNIESEFGKLDGNPSSISEYRTGTPNQVGGGGTVFGIRGVPRAGQVAFSNFRNKIARATPQKVIDSLKVGLGGGTISGVGNSYFSFGLAGVKGAVDNSGGNFEFSTNFTTSNLDEDVRACEGNTVVYLTLGKSSSGTEAIYGLQINGAAVNTPDVGGGTEFTGTGNPNVQGGIVTSTIDTRSGFRPVGEYPSFNYSVKSSLAVAYDTLGLPNPNDGLGASKNPPRSLSSVSSARMVNGGAWRGYGGGDTDSQVQSAMLLIPNRWVLRTYGLYTEPAPSFQLGPYEIAIVCYAINNYTDYPPLPVKIGNNGPTNPTRLFMSRQNARGQTVFVVYANESNEMPIYSLGNSTLFPGYSVVTGGGSGYIPVVYIFSMTFNNGGSNYPGGDGYLSSRVV